MRLIKGYQVSKTGIGGRLSGISKDIPFFPPPLLGEGKKTVQVLGFVELVFTSTLAGEGRVGGII